MTAGMAIALWVRNPQENPMMTRLTSPLIGLVMAVMLCAGCSDNSLTSLQPDFLMSWPEESGYQPDNFGSSAIAFGAVNTGSMDTIRVQISNSGGSELLVSDLYLAEAIYDGGDLTSETRLLADPQLSLVDTEDLDGGTSVARDSTLEFGVRLSPLYGEPLSDGLVLAVKHELSGELPVFVPITGTGHGDPVPDIYAKPGLVAFGTVQLGQGVPSEVLVGNNGPGTLQIGSVRVVGEDASHFSLSAVTLEESTLDTGEFDMVSVSVQATQQGPLEAAIEVRSNDGDEDPLLIPLIATADGDPVSKSPIAVCGPTLFSAPTQTEQLDGMDSFDPQGQWLTYKWTFTPPPGSVVGLDDSTSPLPITDPLDLAGTYTGELVVTNEDGIPSAPCQQLVEAVPNENFRVEIFWDQVDDMDLHLLEANNGAGVAGTPRSDGDCYFANCTGGPFGPPPDWGVAGLGLDDPSLDLDDISGLGPENINILDPALTPHEGWYEVFVHDYPETVYSGPTNVTANIYLNAALTQTYQFVMTGEDDDFYVAKIHWPTGQVVACNGLGGCP